MIFIKYKRKRYYCYFTKFFGSKQGPLKQISSRHSDTTRTVIDEQSTQHASLASGRSSDGCAPTPPLPVKLKFRVP